jgi:hypothetical protein
MDDGPGQWSIRSELRLRGETVELALGTAGVLSQGFALNFFPLRLALL